jgi:hypothetical protein
MNLWAGLLEFQGLMTGRCESAVLTRQRASPLNDRRGALYTQNIILSYRDIHSTKAFLALLDIKGNPVAFFQGFESGCIDCGMMNKHILAALLLDESEPFLVAKPLDGSIGHNNILLS